jgi:hypothetical protein
VRLRPNLTRSYSGLSALAELQLAGALMLFPGAVVFALATALMMRDE